MDLSRRKPMTLENRIAFEQVVPIHGKHHRSENNVQYSNLTDWYHSPSNSTKQKTRSTESLLSLSHKRRSVSKTSPSISERRSSMENNNETLDHNRSPISSVVQPDSIVIGPRILDKLCTCQITMSYRSDPTLLPMAYDSRRDEVMIFQITNNGFTWIVFKGFLKMNDCFTFKSQRSLNDRFYLKFEINDSLDATISACCEHSYRRGGRIDDGDSSFWIKTVEQYTSCAKCQENIDLSLPSDDEKVDLASNTDSEESEIEEDQSVVSEKSTEKVEPSAAKPTQATKPSIDSSSSSADTKKVPETPVLIAKAQAPPAVPKSTTQKDSSVDNESILLKYVNDVMQQALSKAKPSQTILPRCIDNLENFTILYIDENEEKDLTLLRSIINCIRIIHDPNTLGTLLATCTDEKFIVIISPDQAQVVLPELQQHKSIQSIYLLSKQTYSPDWIHDYNKIIGIYRNIELIRDHLIKALPHISSRMIQLEITSKDSTTDLALTYCQLLKETILCQDDESDLKKDLLTFCRLHYVHNQEELHMIDEFEKSFAETDSIQWYTRHCFLSKILSRAFRTQEIDLLFKMRYFIQCLHKQIQLNTFKQPTTVYIILDVEEEIIRKFQENLSGLVLFRSFLPATFARPTPMGCGRSLVFSIRLRPDCAANIEQFRSSDCKIDVLINLNTVFRVVSIDKDENGIHTVNLESISHEDLHFQQLTESLRKEIQASVVILQLTKLLLETNHYWEGDYLAELIYHDKSFEGDATLLASLAAAHHLLGNVGTEKRDFEAASYQFFKSLRAFQLFLSYNHKMLSSSYNNIGNMFYQDDQHEHAMKFHEMALQCQLKASNPDMDSVATYSTNIAAVYIDQKNYTEALKHLKRAEIIREKMPIKDNAKPLISLFQKISSCFWRTKEYEEALEYYKTTLEFQLALPDPLPYPLSITYYNLSTAYTQVNDYDQAVTCAEKSVEELRKIPEKQEELKENQAQLEIVRQKQWLKQVLSV